ncbi:hypothetical protein BDW74DRAFT_161825 [Aspergillus multicolor]|uniref:uncharacterized protein n=1 Tax=Aspergillus multicolor TaxID=41759 RepID=UPI003CCD779E
MSSSILHSCPFCGHITDVSVILADFADNPHCTQCGLSVSESNSKAQDDLVSLFNTNMTMGSFSVSRRTELPASPSSTTYSITQHYHHSAHVAHRAAVQAPATLQRSGFSGANRTASQVFEMLMKHHIDPSSLSPNQLELFAKALPNQQSRLIQMWQICPGPSGNTTLLQTSQVGDFGMCHSARAPTNGHKTDDSAEPYMLAGYGLAAHDSESRRILSTEHTPSSLYGLSNDLVYQAGGQGWWERTQTTAMDS